MISQASDSGTAFAVDGERRIMRALSSGDTATLRGLLDPAVLFLTGDIGYVPAQDLFSIFGMLRVDSFSIDEMHALAPSPDARIVSYRLRQSGRFQDQPFSSDTYSTSVWALADGRWSVIMHQETPVKKV